MCGGGRLNDGSGGLYIGEVVSCYTDFKTINSLLQNILRWTGNQKVKYYENLQFYHTD